MIHEAFVMCHKLLQLFSKKINLFALWLEGGLVEFIVQFKDNKWKRKNHTSHKDYKELV
jgi:hypothetical protein